MEHKLNSWINKLPDYPSCDCLRDPRQIMDEAELTKTIVCGERSYTVPLDVANELEAIKADRDSWKTTADGYALSVQTWIEESAELKRLWFSDAAPAETKYEHDYYLYMNPQAARR